MAKKLWKKGQSGNPNGRPKLPDWFKEHTQEAQERLLFWMKSDNPKASMQATTLFLAYGLGKPIENINHSGSINLESILGETHG